MSSIQHVNFVSEAYMPRTYIQIVRKSETELEIRLSNRADSGLFTVRDVEKVWLQMDTGHIPSDKEIGIPSTE